VPVDDAIARFRTLTTKNGGIESLLNPTDDSVSKHLLTIGNGNFLSKVQLDQLLGLRRERAMSDDFFEYYWLSEPKAPYKLSTIYGYSDEFRNREKIISVDHLLYGITRIFIDGLLRRGNVRAFYRENSNKTRSELESMQGKIVLDTDAIKKRGPILPLKDISKDDRYLISEMACKSHDTSAGPSSLREGLIAAWKVHEAAGGKQAMVKDLLSNSLSKTKFGAQQGLLTFSADDILNEAVNSTFDVDAKCAAIEIKFQAARDAALANTDLYLSLVNDLDVYVATSMRVRADFRAMAERCERIFNATELSDLHLRYFDPTMSAAGGHQDKGLIECLMVKCAKVLVYCAGEKESYGKDAEAAMALSLGKPVIFLCDESVRESFYKDVHPLSRLINFETGVAVGAIVTSQEHDVPMLLDRIFENEMEYEVVQPPDREGYLQLKECLTDSIVRIQTNNQLLSESFWNYYGIRK
jgi:hypothetical protein